MKRHAAIGADILAVIGFPYPLVPIVRHHHENWDGTRLSRWHCRRADPDWRAHPAGRRLLRRADVDRPYRPRLEDAEALQIVTDRSGTMYDPRVVAALVELRWREPFAPQWKRRRRARRAAAAVALRDAGADPRGGRRAAFARDVLRSRSRRSAHRSPPRSVGDTLWSHLRGHMPGSAFVFYVYDQATDACDAGLRAGEPTVAPARASRSAIASAAGSAATGQPIVNSDARLDLDADVRDATHAAKRARRAGVARRPDVSACSRSIRAARTRSTSGISASPKPPPTWPPAALHTVAPRLTAVAV